MKIALVGSAPSSVALGPYRDRTFAEFLGARPQQHPPSPWLGERWQIWGCSPGAVPHVPRADRWFEVHRWEPGKDWFSPAYLQFLRDFAGPVYVGGPVPPEDAPSQVPYPIERVEAEFSSYFLSSSVSLMAAVAILEIEERRKQRQQGRETWAKASAENPGIAPGKEFGALLDEKDADDVIGMWGIDMAADEEYKDQRKGCQFFVLEALRRGIGIYLPQESDLLRPPPIYGLAEWDHAYIKATIRARELSMQKQQMQAQHQELTAKLMQQTGYEAGFNCFINTWMSPYGLPHGQVLRMDPGNPGLGGGITVFKGNKVTETPKQPEGPPTVDPAIGARQAMAEMAMSAGAQAADKANLAVVSDAFRKLADATPSRLRAHVTAKATMPFGHARVKRAKKK